MASRTIDMDTLTEEQQKMLRDAARRGSYGALTRVMKEIEKQKVSRQQVSHQETKVIWQK